MALIKCPECGKEISDKAESCPNCGFKVGEQNDIVFLCPYCLESRLEPIDKKYRAGRGALGYMLVGPIGALAGAAGLNKVEFNCKGCGRKFKAFESVPVRVKDMDVVREGLRKAVKEKGEKGVVDYLFKYMMDAKIDGINVNLASFYNKNWSMQDVQPMSKSTMALAFSIMSSVILFAIMSLFGIIDFTIPNLLITLLLLSIAWFLFFFLVVEDNKKEDKK